MDGVDADGPELLRAVAEQTSDAVWAISPDWSELAFANARCEGVWARDVETLRSDPRSVLSAVHPDDRQAVSAAFDRVARGRSVELRCRVDAGQGAVRHVELQGEPFRDDDGNVTLVLGTASDETEQVSLRTDRDRYQRILDNVRDGIYLYDVNERLVFVNRVAVEFSPLSREELLGGSLSELVDETLTDGLAPETIRDRFDLLVTGEREEVRDRLWFETVEGPRPFAVRSARVESENGEFAGVVSVLRDISEQVETERTLRERNDRLSEFAGIVSHDLRNPLNVATGHLEMARRERDSDHLEAVADAHDRIEELISDLLTVTRVGRTTPEFESVELASLVRNCWGGVATGERTVVVETERTVRADPSQLRQMFENLFRNAVEHAGADVTVTVGDLSDGFFVADDGPGIPASERDSVFDTGYTTTDAGTGLGLDIVEEIASAHDWEVTVADSVDGGARFEFTGVEFR